jgi:hypothetical protein
VRGGAAIAMQRTNRLIGSDFEEMYTEEDKNTEDGEET